MLGSTRTVTGLHPDLAWSRYCGFLDLSVPAFLRVQEEELIGTLPQLTKSGIWRALFDQRTPASLAAFRDQVPLTDYADYADYMDESATDLMPAQPVLWASASRRNAVSALIPYTRRALDQMGSAVTAAFLLASASGRGEVGIAPGDRVLFNLPPAPYLSGAMGTEMARRLDLRALVGPDEASTMDFRDKVVLGFQRGLRSGVDVGVAMTSVLLKVGRDFEAKDTNRRRLSKAMLHPSVALRIARARWRSWREHRPMLPKDLWPMKALICWGTDTAAHREELKRYWGCEPFEFLAASECGVIATQTWTHAGMTFLPHGNFLEFLPRDGAVVPADGSAGTVLLDELRAGQTYEVVTTSTNGLPFVRYRTGLLVKVLANQDMEAGVRLPQVDYLGRADELIDIEGFTRLDATALGRAIESLAEQNVRWTARKEFEGSQAVLRVFVESPWLVGEGELRQALRRVDPYYRDLEDMLGMRPLRVTQLRAGAFDAYARDPRTVATGATAPPRVNASDADIAALTKAPQERTAAA